MLEIYNHNEYFLREITPLDLDAGNRPGLATVSRDHVSRSASGALGVGVVGVSDVHNELGVDVFVSSVSAASGGLALRSSAPTLGNARICRE